MVLYTTNNNNANNDNNIIKLNENLENNNEINESNNIKSSLRSNTETVLSSTEKLNIRTENIYDIVYGSSHSTDYSWLGTSPFAEPYRQTWLHITNSLSSEKYLYKWIIYDGDETIELECPVVTHEFKTLGSVSFSLSEYNRDSGELTRNLESIIIVKYVRRELRSLFDEDKEAYLNAMYTLWSVPTDDGQELYGEDYLDAEYFANYHLILAAERGCDHMHDSYGFLTQHMALDLKFEQSLQLVDPSVALHYWDFTVDIQETLDKNESIYSIKDNFMFTDEWFGSTNENDLYIQDGRWAKAEVSNIDNEDKKAYLLNMFNDLSYSYLVDEGTDDEKILSTVNSYGYFRAPWNANKSPYVTRSWTMCGADVDDYWEFPGCSSHFSVVAKTFTWEEISWLASYTPHGPMHALIGGVFGTCSTGYDELLNYGFTENDISVMKNIAFQFPKNLWRNGVIECGTDCGINDECYCLPSDETLQSYVEMPMKILQYCNFPESYYSMPPKVQSLVVDIIFKSKVFYGDQLEAASPIDPTFWPLHPTLERLLTWKRINKLFSDESWASADSISCTGHSANDEIKLTNLIKGYEKETFTMKNYINIQIQKNHFYHIQCCKRTYF